MWKEVGEKEKNICTEYDGGLSDLQRESGKKSNNIQYSQSLKNMNY